MTDTTDSANDLEQKLKDAFAKLAARRKATRIRAMWTGLFLGTIQLALVPLILYWQGYVLATLWAWFVNPVFHIVLPIYFAAGAIITTRLLVRSEHTYANPFMAVFAPAVMLGLGWVWRWLGWGFI